VTLADHLGHCFAESRHVAGHRGAHAALAEAVKAELELKTAARTELERLRGLDRMCNGSLERRCVISHTHKIALERALADV